MFAVQKAAVREKCSRWRQVQWILSRNRAPAVHLASYYAADSRHL